MKNFKEILLLKKIKGIGNVIINKEYIPMIERGIQYNELVQYLSDKYGEKIIKRAIDEMEKSINDIETDESEIDILTVFDSTYPKNLFAMGDNKPPVLYVKGNSKILNYNSIAVIGTRNPSAKANYMNESIVRKIVRDYNWNIISGFAMGCDKIAHRATLKNRGKTIAVLAKSFDKITALEEKKMVEEIINNNGCIISEYEPHTVVNKGNFIKRNAIIATLSKSIIVIECGIESGTMHTVKYAHKMHRIIGCCYSEDFIKESIDGKEYIVRNYDGITIEKLKDIDQLMLEKEFLCQVEEQITLKI